VEVVVLISTKELKKTLEDQNIDRYYIEIDMNGVLTLAVDPMFSDIRDNIEMLLKKIDQARSSDDIYELNEILYPLKKIIIDNDDDEETLENFKGNKIIVAPYTQQLNTWRVDKEGKKKNKENKKGNKEETKSRPPRVAFYSYKGGVGRSTALAVTARLLANEGFRVAVVDLDLEAPGLNSLLLTKPKTSPFGVVDYLSHIPWVQESMDKKRFLSQYVVREDVPRRNEKPGQLIVMSAGGTKVQSQSEDVNFLFGDDEVEIALDTDYLLKLSYIDFDLYTRQKEHVFEKLLNDLAQYSEADIILLDARTGLSNVSGAILNYFSDVLSIHIQDNRQNREGIGYITKYMRNHNYKKILWSLTKISKSYFSEHSDLNEFISEHINNQKENDFNPIDLNHLPYDSLLEDINSHDLKKHIDNDRISIGYKELMEQILAVTDLDQLLSSYIDPEDRKEMLLSMKLLVDQDKDITYISQRFINEELEMYVGFPGSGKKTFAKYMKEKHNKDVNVISFEEFDKMSKSAHHILSHVLFLDWSYEEATQAVCKWFLQSEVFFNWLHRNEKLFEEIDSEELVKMKKEEGYEVPLKIAEEILNIIFQKEKIPISGWRRIFSRLQYRENHVLPKDMIKGIKLFIAYFFEREINQISRRKNTAALFKIIIHPATSKMYRGILKEIGQQKIEWLSQFDKRLFYLINSFQELKYNSGNQKNNQFTPNNIDIDFGKEEMKKIYAQNIDEESFDETYQKALNMDIFKIRKQGIRGNENDLITLSPVYQLIPLEITEEDQEN
jgi:hypothetical protein